MYVKNIKINSDCFEDILALLIESKEPKNIINFTGGVQLAYENHPFFNKQCSLFVVLVLKHPDSTNISLMSGGSGIDLLSKIGITTDKSAVENYFSDIDMYCKSNELLFEILDEDLIT